MPGETGAYPRRQLGKFAGARAVGCDHLTRDERDPRGSRNIAVALGGIRQHIAAAPTAVLAMRPILVLALLLPLAAGCTPRIPVEDDFGTSALVPKGHLPPEFSAFNRYDPKINAQLAEQLCATPYTELEGKALAAEPGELAAWRGRCQDHVLFFGSAPSWQLSGR